MLNSQNTLTNRSFGSFNWGMTQEKQAFLDHSIKEARKEMLIRAEERKERGIFTEIYSKPMVPVTSKQLSEWNKQVKIEAKKERERSFNSVGFENRKSLLQPHSRIVPWIMETGKGNWKSRQEKPFQYSILYPARHGSSVENFSMFAPIHNRIIEHTDGTNQNVFKHRRTYSNISTWEWMEIAKNAVCDPRSSNTAFIMGFPASFDKIDWMAALIQNTMRSWIKDGHVSISVNMKGRVWNDSDQLEVFHEWLIASKAYAETGLAFCLVKSVIEWGVEKLKANPDLERENYFNWKEMEAYVLGSQTDVYRVAGFWYKFVRAIQRNVVSEGDRYPMYQNLQKVCTNILELALRYHSEQWIKKGKLQSGGGDFLTNNITCRTASSQRKYYEVLAEEHREAWEASDKIRIRRKKDEEPCKLTTKQERRIRKKIRKIELRILKKEKKTREQLEKAKEMLNMDTNLRCRGCNTIVKPEQVFCIECGTQLGDLTHCPNCGKQLQRNGQNFCGICKFDLKTFKVPELVSEHIPAQSTGKPIEGPRRGPKGEELPSFEGLDCSLKTPEPKTTIVTQPGFGGIDPDSSQSVDDTSFRPSNIGGEVDNPPTIRTPMVPQEPKEPLLEAFEPSETMTDKVPTRYQKFSLVDFRILEDQLWNVVRLNWIENPRSDLDYKAKQQAMYQDFMFRLAQTAWQSGSLPSAQDAMNLNIEDLIAEWKPQKAPEGLVLIRQDELKSLREKWEAEYGDFMRSSSVITGHPTEKSCHWPMLWQTLQYRKEWLTRLQKYQVAHYEAPNKEDLTFSQQLQSRLYKMRYADMDTFLEKFFWRKLERVLKDPSCYGELEGIEFQRSFWDELGTETERELWIIGASLKNGRMIDRPTGTYAEEMTNRLSKALHVTKEQVKEAMSVPFGYDRDFMEAEARLAFMEEDQLERELQKRGLNASPEQLQNWANIRDKKYGGVNPLETDIWPQPPDPKPPT